jgi:hypothetical protein
MRSSFAQEQVSRADVSGFKNASTVCTKYSARSESGGQTVWSPHHCGGGVCFFYHGCNKKWRISTQTLGSNGGMEVIHEAGMVKDVLFRDEKSLLMF